MMHASQYNTSNINEITSCPICGDERYKVLFHDRNRRDNIDCSGTYVQCGGCSLVYLKDHPPWQEIVNYYSSVENEHTPNGGNTDVEAIKQQADKPVQRWKKLLRRLRFRPHSWPLNSVPKGTARILDLGCGSGAKLFEFYGRGYEVWGVDVGRDSIRLCSELLPEGHFLVGELQETGLPDEHFDYIRIDNALEHVPNPGEVIRECRRLLCKGGKLMVYVPHGRSLSLRLIKGDSISSWIPFHLQLFTKTSLRYLLRGAGFTDIRIYNYNPTSWLPLSLLQWSRRKNPTLKANNSTWLTMVCYPFGVLASILGIGEELVVRCINDGKH